MAGIAKIASKNLDEVNKINSAVLIGLGTAAVGEVRTGETFYAGSTVLKTGTMPTVALDPGSNAYPTGYHAGAANLTAVDGDLITGNIKNGITIFNVNGSVDVRDVSDANALVGEVMAGRTFFAVGGAVKTGTLATVAITAVNDDYLPGYHVGNVGGLSAIDVNLAAANIRSGVDIFGFVGPATVQEIGAANAVLADVKNGITFFSITGGIKTGNLATVALAADNSAYPAGYHAGAASLQAVDAHLTPANIALGVNIFGYVGTLAATLAEDVTGDARSAVAGGATGATIRDRSHALDGETEEDEVSITETYNDPSLTVASVVLMVRSGADCTLRLYMDGVEMAESPTFTQWFAEILVATKAMAGVDKVCEAKVYNPTGDAVFWAPYCNSYNAKDCCYIMVGSVKV